MWSAPNINGPTVAAFFRSVDPFASPPIETKGRLWAPPPNRTPGKQTHSNCCKQCGLRTAGSARRTVTGVASSPLLHLLADWRPARDSRQLATQFIRSFSQQLLGAGINCAGHSAWIRNRRLRAAEFDSLSVIDAHRLLAVFPHDVGAERCDGIVAGALGAMGRISDHSDRVIAMACRLDVVVLVVALDPRPNLWPAMDHARRRGRAIVAVFCRISIGRAMFEEGTRPFVSGGRDRKRQQRGGCCCETFHIAAPPIGIPLVSTLAVTSR